MRRHWLDAAAPRVIALTVLFAAAPFIEAAHQHSLTGITNADFWWHLRTGLGILQSHALPHTGLYSQSSAMPWMASSWLYDVKIAIGYRMFGLLYVPMIAIASKLLLAVLTFLLAGGWRGRFWPAVTLSAVAQAILISWPPLPLYSSVLFFALELLLLMESRRTGNVRPLYWLPLLFLLWANLDVQFVVGVFVLLLFVATMVIENWSTRVGLTWMAPSYRPLFRAMKIVMGASLLATALTPYGASGYRLYFLRATSAAAPYFPDFTALRFRTPQDYLLLLLIGAAFLALGMRRSRDIFQIALLLFCTFASFHSQRDAWLATLVAVAVVASALRSTTSQETGESSPVAKPPLLVAAGLAIVLLTATAVIHFPRSRDAALAKIGAAYPVAAADYIRDHHLPPPLFNSLPWGGFLTWYLPEYPVAIDGRTDLYGADFNIQYAKVMNADAHFSTFAPLNQADILLLEKNSLMGIALATVPGFKVAYSDNVAVVLVREQPQP